MNLKLNQMLARLGEFRRSAPPTRIEVSKRAGIDLPLVTRIFSIPQTKLSAGEMDRLISYLFNEFRPFISTEITDQQLVDHLRFEILGFEHGGAEQKAGACCYSADGKYTLRDLTFS